MANFKFDIQLDGPKVCVVSNWRPKSADKLLADWFIFHKFPHISHARPKWFALWCNPLSKWRSESEAITLKAQFELESQCWAKTGQLNRRWDHERSQECQFGPPLLNKIITSVGSLFVSEDGRQTTSKFVNKSPNSRKNSNKIRGKQRPRSSSSALLAFFQFRSSYGVSTFLWLNPYPKAIASESIKWKYQKNIR